MIHMYDAYFRGKIADNSSTSIQRKMAGDLSHFLLPNSRLPKDVSFLVSGKEVEAHKSLLASQHQIFDKMFFEDEGGIAKTAVKVCDLQLHTSFETSNTGEG